MPAQTTAHSRVADLVDDGWDALERGDIADAASAARHALAIDPQCIDAWNVLAEADDVTPVKIALWREAVRLGQIEHAGDLTFPSQASFWLSIETRPYMRAVRGLAIALWDQNGEGDREEATDRIAHLLRINPNDNQGVRYLAYDWYPAVRRSTQLTTLLRRHRTANCNETRYALALDGYRRGDPKADELLDRALAGSPAIATFLLADDRPASITSASVGYGTLEAAQDTAARSYETWRTTEDAVAWLQRRVRLFESRV